MLKIPEDIYNAIIEHVKESYPHECCGVLAGRGAEVGCAEAPGVSHGKVVVEARRMSNRNRERAADRYEIDPGEMLTVERDLGDMGLDIIGFYHSHPDHPARPSEFDRQRGWPEYSYVIVAVRGGVETEASCWTFVEDGEPFREEEFYVGDHTAGCEACEGKEDRAERP